MALTSEENRKSYIGNGVTTTFPFPIKFFEPEDLKVLVTDHELEITMLLTLDTDYSVTGEGNHNGGQIILLKGPLAQDRVLVIFRDPKRTQDMDLTENSNLPFEEVEKTYDRSTMWAIRDKERIDRSVRLSEAFSKPFNPLLPVNLPPLRTLQINESGTGFMMGPSSTEIANAEAKAIEAAQSAAASAAAANAADASADAAAISELNSNAAQIAAEEAEGKAALHEASARDLKQEAEALSLGFEETRNEVQTARNETITAKNQAIEAKDAAAQSASGISEAVTTAIQARNAAVSAKTDSEAARDLAQTSASNASQSANAASTVQSSVEAARDASVSAKNEAVSSKDAAATSAQNAQNHATQASDSKDAAQTSATNAAGSATAAQESELTAAEAAQAASEFKTDAQSAAVSAAGSAVDANAAKVAAEAARDEAVAAGGGGITEIPDHLVIETTTFKPVNLDTMETPPEENIKLINMDGQLQVFEPSGMVYPIQIDRGSSNDHPFKAAYESTKFHKHLVDSYPVAQWEGTHTQRLNVGPAAALNLPTDCAFSPDGNFLVVVNATTAPFVDVYQVNQSQNTFTKMAAPATPGAAVRCVAWSKFSNYFFVGLSAAPWFKVYWLNPNTRASWILEANTWGVSLGGAVNSIDIFGADEYMVLGCDTTPFINVFQMDVGSKLFTKLANPAVLPQGACKGVAFSRNSFPVGEYPSSPYIACAMSVAPFAAFYKLVTDDWPATLVRQTNVMGTPTSAAKSVAWGGEDGTRVLFSVTSDPFMLGYDFDPSTATFTGISAVPNSATKPNGSVNKFVFSPDGKSFTAADPNATYPVVWNNVRRNNYGSKNTFPQPNTSAGGGLSVSWNRNKKYICFCHTGTPFLGIYKASEMPPVFQALGIME